MPYGQRVVQGAPDDRVAAVELRDVRKSFGRVEAVSGIDLAIAPGEFFALLGPSGSGKTTVLRMIAGFDLPSSGQVLLDGTDVTRRAPFERDVTTVFQDYALFPHMDVRDNVAYGLRVRGVGRAARRAQAEETLATVRLEGFGDRLTTELSGGQRQRVALARALVVEPKVLLLDEPLGALDLKLREQMQVELKDIQRQVGITFVFVTHDQDEALTMSDRLAVLAEGHVAQVGTPAEVYERPATGFVAGFVGTSNLIDGSAARELFGREGTFSVRPEKLHVAFVGQGDGAGDGNGHGATGADQVVARGSVADVVYAGADTRYVVDLDVGARVTAVEQNLQTSSMEVLRHRGAPVRLSWHREHCYEISDGDHNR